MFAAGRKEMQEMDRYTMETIGLPGVVLMENAGAKVAKELLMYYKESKIAVFAGSGSNGGDGFVIARRMHDAGVDCVLYLAADPDRIKGDAKIHFDVYRNRQLPIVYVDEKSLKDVNKEIEGADVIVDALLGTGTKGFIREPIKTVISEINKSTATVIAVDIPSGVDSDTGEVRDIAVKAHKTITFVAPKKGFFLQEGHSISEGGRPLIFLCRPQSRMICRWICQWS